MVGISSVNVEPEDVPEILFHHAALYERKNRSEDGFSGVLPYGSIARPGYSASSFSISPTSSSGAVDGA